jgi:hypothetical protein
MIHITFDYYSGIKKNKYNKDKYMFGSRIKEEVVMSPK